MSYWLHRRGSPIRWQLGFETLRAAIGPLLGDLDATTEHVGSTPVPGPAAQPIIDVDVLVAGLDEVGAAIAVLQAAGWARQGDPYRAEGPFGPGVAPRTTASTWSLMAARPTATTSATATTCAPTRAPPTKFSLASQGTSPMSWLRCRLATFGYAARSPPPSTRVGRAERSLRSCTASGATTGPQRPSSKSCFTWNIDVPLIPDRTRSVDRWRRLGVSVTASGRAVSPWTPAMNQAGGPAAR